MNKHENAEIVVIGGGAVGTAVACYLARDGADVALVERGEYAGAPAAAATATP